MAAPSLVHGVTIDTYTDALPPNPSLPITHARVLWHGLYCDDIACPPGTAVTHDDVDLAEQVGLAGAQGANRSVLLQLDPHVSVQAVLSIDPTTQTLRLNEANGLEDLVLVYVTWTKPQGLNLDLTSGGAGGIGFEIAGFNLHPPDEAILTNLTLTSHSGEPNAITVSVPFSITSPGLFEAPFQAFGNPQLDFRDIDEITMLLESYVAAAEISVGPLHTIAHTTSAGTMTWGRLKSLYR